MAVGLRGWGSAVGATGEATGERTQTLPRRRSPARASGLEREPASVAEPCARSVRGRPAHTSSHCTCHDAASLPHRHGHCPSTGASRDALLARLSREFRCRPRAVKRDVGAARDVPLSCALPRAARGASPHRRARVRACDRCEGARAVLGRRPAWQNVCKPEQPRRRPSMPRSRKPKPFRGISEAELAVLEALWKAPGAPNELQERLARAGSDWAYTTVQTLLHRMLEKGFVTRKRAGVAQIYSAVLDRNELLARHVNDLADRLCAGSMSPLLLS